MPEHYATKSILRDYQKTGTVLFWQIKYSVHFLPLSMPGLLYPAHSLVVLIREAKGSGCPGP